MTILCATEHTGVGRRPIDAWDLAAVSEAYHDFLTTHLQRRDQLSSGGISAADGLRARTRLTEPWRSFLGIDPGLPAVALPDDWPRQLARELFVEVYDALGPLAAVRMRQIVDRHSPAAAQLVASLTVDQLLRIGLDARERQPCHPMPSAPLDADLRALYAPTEEIPT